MVFQSNSHFPGVTPPPWAPSHGPAGLHFLFKAGGVGSVGSWLVWSFPHPDLGHLRPALFSTLVPSLVSCPWLSPVVTGLEQILVFPGVPPSWPPAQASWLIPSFLLLGCSSRSESNLSSLAWNAMPFPVLVYFCPAHENPPVQTQ